jgi:hypothetical protein
MIGLTAGAVLTLGASAPAQVSPQDVVLARAATYVGRFVEVFSNLVATEKYLQDVRPANTMLRLRSRPGPGSHRELESDFLLLNVGGPLEWRPYRDVYRVDNKPVRDRDDRLTRLFSEPATTRLEQAARIAQESARHNIGLAARTVNTPVLALLLHQEHVQHRFDFKVAGRDGRNVIVEYDEEFRPTIIRGTRSMDDADLPASGRFWIDGETGRVARSTLRVAHGEMRTQLTTTYRDDERFGIAVPTEMKEEVEFGRTLTTGTATYGNFRRFEVKTEAETTEPIER